MDGQGFSAFGYAPPPHTPHQQPQQQPAGDPRSLASLFQSGQYGQAQHPPPPPPPPLGLSAGYAGYAAYQPKDEDGGRSDGWGGSTASESSSDQSPPPSAPTPATGGTSDWDLLSEMLLDDALGSATAAGLVPPPPVTRAQFHAFPALHAPQQVSMGSAWPQQQVVGYHQRLGQFQAPVEPPSLPSGARALGFQAALGGAGSPPSLLSIQTPVPASDSNISPSQRPRPTTTASRQKKRTKQPSRPKGSPQPSISSSSSASGSPVSASVVAVASNPPTDATMSAEEAKKLRRRTQIASSVQRHREKKKCVVSALKTELGGLTATLEQLRVQRKGLHADARLVEWEEAAVTQRRKRKQAQELNARMKKALFQQTAFLVGMRGLLRGAGEPLAPGEMEFHDWIHSYTVLSARGQEARSRELLAHFSESKMDLAKKLVLRETDPVMPRLSRKAPYFAATRVLHDGTRRFLTEPDHDAFVIKQEISALRSSGSSTEQHEAGDGRVLKKFTSVFLFEESAAVTLERLHALVFESTKGVGIYWPAEGYASRQFNHAPVPTSSASGGVSNVFYVDMTASMTVMDDLLVARPGSKAAEDERDIFVEARVLCREARDEHEGLIVWDYVDRDDQSETPAAVEGKPRAIRRDCCGAVVIKREPGGLLSVRSISVKMFAPDGAAGGDKLKIGGDADQDEEEEQLRALFRRIGLQATEAEREREKCTRFVYNALQAALAAGV